MYRIYDDLKQLKYEANQTALSGNIEKAIRILEGICFIDPNSFDSHFNLGKLYYKQNNIKKSKEHFTKALEIKPNDKNTIIHLELLNEDNERKDLFNEKKSTHLKILFLQNSPCIRNYKYAVALRKRGLVIDLAYTEKSLAERYPGLSNNVYNNIFKINSYPQLWNLAQNYDLIHSHNEPDTLTVAALACNKPLIHDTHDLISLRNQNKPDLGYFEGIANRAPAGRIYSTEFQKELAFKMYNFEAISEVFYNFISEDDKPKQFKEKLSEKDGKVHIVYEGGIGGAKHRNFHNIFIELAKLGFEIHIYPALYMDKTAEIFSSYKNIHYYKPVSPTILMEEMTKYDFGIIPWNVTRENKLFLDSTIANKLFEYLAAGLPVIASEVESYVRFFKQNELGITFREPKEILDKLSILNKIKDELRDKGRVFSYEQNAEKIIKFYHKVIDNYSHKKPFEEKQKITQSKSNQSVTIIAFVEPKYKQLHAKILGQYNALKSLGSNVNVFLLGNGYNNLKLDYPFKFIDTFGRADIRNDKVREILQSDESKFIYFRYPNGYKDGLEGLLPIIKQYDNIIFEHNTKEEEDAKKNNHPNALNQEVLFGRKLIGMAKGLVTVTNEIAEYQKKRAGLDNLKVEAIGNGINVSDYPLAKQQELFDKFDMVFVGYIALHHGIERMFAGMRDYQGSYKLRLFIAGKSFNSSYQDYLYKLTEDYGIKDNVIWLGELSKSELDRFFDISHIAIGSLGWHRIDQPEAATLKTREYLSRGLPLVIDHKDIDIYENCEFVFKASYDEQPIKIESLISFVQNLHVTNKDIRAFAFEKLDWKVKMQKLLEFFSQLEDSDAMKNKHWVIPQDALVIILNDDFDENIIFVRKLLNENQERELVFVVNQIKGRTKQLFEKLADKFKIIQITSDNEYYEFKDNLVKREIAFIEKTSIKDGNYRKFRKKDDFEDYYNNFSK